MTEIEKYERMLAKHEDARKALLQRKIELDEAIYRVSFDVHAAGDKKACDKARNNLEKFQTERRDLASEIDSVEAAITETNRRLDAARAAEISAADRQTAKQIAALNTEFAEQLRDADAAAADMISSVLNAQELLTQMRELGIAAPIDRLFLLNVTVAIKTALQLLPRPYVNEIGFDWVAPNQRKEFRHLANTWGVTIANQIAAKFGPIKDEAA